MPNFYIRGENYSTYQAWCEGALLTSNSVISIKLLYNIVIKIRVKKHVKNPLKKHVELDDIIYIINII